MKVGTDGVLLGAWAEGGRKILDVGTGTGLVALMMAQRFTDADVTGIEICDEAVDEALHNVSRSPFCNRVRIEKRDFRNFVCQERFDALVCNPPYFEKSLKCPEMGRSIARHSDTLSICELMEGAVRTLAGNGVLSIIIPYMQFEEVLTEGVRCGFSVKRAMKVRGTGTGEWKRVLVSFQMGNERCWKMEEMTLEYIRGVRTEEYQRLTEDFYL